MRKQVPGIALQGLIAALCLAGCAIPDKPIHHEKAEPVTVVEPAAAPAPAPETTAPAQPAAKAEEGLHPLLVQAYGEVNMADGIDETEAETIADTYFDLYISGNGMANGVTDKGTAWEVSTFIDYDMRPWQPIQVDKKTGVMTCQGYPTVSPR